MYVTGTFDDWSKSVKLEKKGSNVHEKLVELARADQKIYYKVSFPVLCNNGLYLGPPALEPVSRCLCLSLLHCFTPSLLHCFTPSLFQLRLHGVFTVTPLLSHVSAAPSRTTWSCVLHVFLARLRKRELRAKEGKTHPHLTLPGHGRGKVAWPDLVPAQTFSCSPSPPPSTSPSPSPSPSPSTLISIPTWILSLYSLTILSSFPDRTCQPPHTPHPKPHLNLTSPDRSFSYSSALHKTNTIHAA